MLSRRLIHNENQFAILKKKFLNLSSTVNLNFKLHDIPSLLIITTQRTGSTLLCNDLEQACNLNYSPTETFIPLLTYIFNKYPNHQNEKIEEILNNAFKFPLKGPVYIHKIMIDYIGWIGFLYAPKDFIESATYFDLSVWTIKSILSKSRNKLPILFLDRTNKLSQASSRLINSMGFPTHLSSEKEKINFNERVKERIEKLSHPEAMVLDQASIIIKQNDILNNIYNDLSKEYKTIKINYENDICDDSFCYFDKFLPKSIFDISKISRKLKKTSNMNSKNLINSTIDFLGLK